MRRRVGVLLFVILLSLACELPALPIFPTATPDESAESEQEEAQEALLVYQILDEETAEVVELGVADSSGEELGRISLSGKMGISNLMALPGNHRAWFHNIDGDVVYLVDAAEGTARQLELPGDASGMYPAAVQFRFSGGGDRWALLGNVKGDSSFLVNLETAQLHDLATIGDDLQFIFSGLFSPDEDYVVLAGSWLVPTEDLDGARQLGTGEFARANSFSSDSQQIVYIQRKEGGEWEAVVERVDAARSEVVATADWFEMAAFVPRQDQLLLARDDGLSLLSLDDWEEQELLEYEGRPQRFWFSPSGQNVLLGYHDEKDDVGLWYLVDLRSDTVQPLSDLTGYLAAFMDSEHRWLTFLDSFERSGGRRFVSLDLESGETSEVLALDVETVWMSLSGYSGDGRLGLVSAKPNEGDMQLWLLRCEAGDGRLLIEGKLGGAAVSPDGRWVAVSTIESTDDGIETELMLMATEGNETRQVGEGSRPIWVVP